MAHQFVLPFSEAKIGAMSAREIADAIFDVVHEHMCANTQFRNEEMIALPQPWRSIWLPQQCKADIDNGGFHQFFWNSEGKLNAALLEDLTRVDAQRYIDVVSKAISVFSEFDYVSEKRRAGLSWHRFTAGYRQKRLDRFDREFYALEPDLREVLEGFVRSNVRTFR